ncbi:MAG TPA: substrate-binding domain-containing protein [Thermoleophilaceae bacterium]|jgi:ribose transport system substrate-binding protein
MLFASAAAAIVLAAAVSACGSSSSSTSSSASSTSGGASTSGSSAKSVKLAMITASTTQNAFQEMADGAKAAADATPGVNLSESAPNGVNGPQEVQLFQSATRTSPDGVATMTTTPDLFVRPFSTAVGQGIPIVAVDAPGLPGSKVTTFVGNSNTQLGESLGKKMLAKIPASATGEIVFGNDIPGLPLLQQRIDGMKKVIQAARPNLKIVGPFNVGAEPTDNYNHWNSVVKAHPNAVAYLAPGDQDAVSFNRIEKETGKHYLVGACDVDPIALQAVQNGNVYALGDPWHFLKGYFAITFLADHAQNGKALPDGWFNPGSGIVDQQNVAQVINREKSNANRVAFFKPTIDKELANPAAYTKPLTQAN